MSLLDLFDGRRQPVVYHFMFEPGEKQVCAGCSAVADSVGHLAHLRARDRRLHDEYEPPKEPAAS